MDFYLQLHFYLSSLRHRQIWSKFISSSIHHLWAWLSNTGVNLDSKSLGKNTSIYHKRVINTFQAAIMHNDTVCLQQRVCVFCIRINAFYFTIPIPLCTLSYIMHTEDLSIILYYNYQYNTHTLTSPSIVNQSKAV